MSTKAEKAEKAIGRLATGKGYITVKHEGVETRVTFRAPKHQNDRKRLGTDLIIQKGHRAIYLNGKDIQAIRSVLDKAEQKVWEAQEV